MLCCRYMLCVEVYLKSIKPSVMRKESPCFSYFLSVYNLLCGLNFLFLVIEAYIISVHSFFRCCTLEKEMD